MPPSASTHPPRSAPPARQSHRPTQALLLATSSLAAVLALLAPTAHAQDAGAATIEEIVVTAQKREQKLGDVPMSVTAASGAELARRNIDDPTDLVRLIPGFSVTKTQFNNAPVYTLRGVGYFEAALAAGPAVSVYVDEVPLAYPSMTNGAFLDLETVEVLKGPQGTLFGQNSTGGAINYIAAKPQAALAGGLTAEYARFDARTLNGFLTGPITDTLSARAAFKVVRSGPWQKSYTRDDELGDTHQDAGRILVDWRPNETLKLELSLNGWDDKSETPAPQDIANILLNPAYVEPRITNAPLAPADARAADWDAGRPFKRDDKFYQAALRAERKLTSDLTVTLISAYSHLDTNSLQEGDGIDLGDLAIRTEGKIDTRSHELRLAGDHADLHWIVGVNYGRDKIDDAERLFTGDSSYSVIAGHKYYAIDAHSLQKVETAAVFGNIDWTFAPDLSVQLGARYTRADRDFVGCASDVGDGLLTAAARDVQAYVKAVLGLPPGTAPVPGGCTTVDANYNPTLVEDSLNQDNASWRAGLSWRPAADTLVYANVSKGYKSGSFPTLAASSYVQFEPVTQEALLAYEAGFKATLLDRTVQLAGAIFYYDYKDKQIRGRIVDPVIGQLERLVNIPKSHVQGAEFSVLWTPLRGLTLNGAATYLDTNIDDYVGINQTGQVADFSGTPFPFSPKRQLVGDVDYRWDVSDRLTGFVGAGVTYHSATNGSAGAEAISKIDAYTLLDLRAGVEAANKTWRLSVWGSNVTDEYYWSSAQRAQDTVIRYAGRPATYGVTLDYKF